MSTLYHNHIPVQAEVKMHFQGFSLLYQSIGETDLNACSFLDECTMIQK